MNRKRTFLALLAVLSASSVFAEWGQTPRLTVVGNHLEDPDGNQVMLHGVMDTPSPYFSGYRFTDGNWINVYNDGDRYINKCKDYFDKLFTAVTDTTQGSYCNVFRLHLDPCWTDNPNLKNAGFTEKGGKVYDPNGTEVSGEASTYHFSKNRLKTYLEKLYLPLAKLAKAHGMYVIMRPPGVCPSTIKVGDYYQEYLTTVWDIVSSWPEVKTNSDWLSIELANEPVGVKNANGQDTQDALHDFFQPIVDKIRANGFDGIIWVPGKTWQQDYKGYKKYPITGENIGYAVHFYPGWFSTSDAQHDPATSIKAFLNSVPVVKTNPIMITEVDWSPEDPNGTGHYNESGQWVVPNCGTWATGSTSKFGEGYKAVLDYFGNIGMTLTHTHDYIDIDQYLKNGQLLPAFHDKLTDNAYEACSGGCFTWYPEYAKAKHEARTDFSDYEASTNKQFTLDAADELIDQNVELDGKTLLITDEEASAIWYVNSENESPQNVSCGTLSDISNNPYCYLKFTKITGAKCKTQGNLFTAQLADKNGNCYQLWGSKGYLNTPPGAWCLFALGLGDNYGQDAEYCGLWKIDYEEGKGYTMVNVGLLEAGQNGPYVSPEFGTPQADKQYVRLFTKATILGIAEIETDAIDNTFTFDLFGNRVNEMTSDTFYIVNGKKVIKAKGY